MSNQALFLSKPNGSFTLETRKSIPIPGPAQLVIRNHAAALAPITVKLRDSPEFAEAMRYTAWPMILGSELAGRVEFVGSNVTRFKPGDRVMGFSLPGTGDLDQGGYQNYTLVNQHLTSHIPYDMTFREACTLPASIGTAVGLLMDAGYEISSDTPNNAKECEALLIWGGSGAVGSCTIQVAKAIGVRTVVTTASAKNAEYLKTLGADVVLDRGSLSLLEDLVRETGARGVKLTRFIDANSSDLPITASIVSDLGGGDLFTVLPWQMANKIEPPSNVRPIQSGVRKVAAEPELGARVMHDLAEMWLADKKLLVTDIEVVSGGLAGVEVGLEKLKQGLSAIKLVLDV